MEENKKIHIAIFGPTGYIGTKLIRDLYNTGHKLTLFSRSTRKLDYLQTDCFLLKHYEPNICIIQQFLEEQYYEDIVYNLQGVDVVYYLVHSLYINEKSNFLSKDNQLASLIAKASTKAGVKQIVYLGGLGVDKPEAPISKHLLSRQDTANYLRKYHNNVTEFRAGVIIGAGSSSFEIIRSLGNKLPFLPKLPGIEGLCQPIFVDDVIAYLIHAKLNELYKNQIVEIGSDDVLTYSEMIRIFALEIRHVELAIVPLPIINRLLTVSVLSYIISHMSNMPYLLIKRLLEGMNSYAIVSDYPVAKIDPSCPIKAKSFKESLVIATQRLEEAMFQSVWSIPYELSVLNAEKKTQFLHLSSKELEGMLFEEYSTKIEVEEMEQVFDTIKTIGGERGYFSPRWLWEIRGFIDKLLNGRGLCPNPRDPRLLRVGDRIDFWEVSYYRNWRDHKVLRLKANMKTPGTAWLQFVIQSSKKRDSATFTLSAYFEPKGIAGYLYWYSLYFIHKFIFKYMVKEIIKESKKLNTLESHPH
jgi:uncharacterized protein YbjT (DUF2867 family)